MESLYFLVPCALIFIALAIKALFWAINSGQYDNLDTEAHRILFDADTNNTQSKEPSGNIPVLPGIQSDTHSDTHPDTRPPQDKD